MTKGNAYMEKNKIGLYIQMAFADMIFYKYQMEKKDDEDWYWDEDIKYARRQYRADAYAKVREFLNLEDEYEKFKLIVVDSQMSWMEKCGKYDETALEYYVKEYNSEKYDPFIFGQTWELEKRIFENGWAWTYLYEYANPDKNFDHEACERLNKLRDREKDLFKSWLTKEEVDGDVTEWHCHECGTTFYAKYRSKYSPAPVCPACGAHDWIWIY